MFVAASLGILRFVGPDLRPAPLYASTALREWRPIVRGETGTLEWHAPAPPTTLLVSVDSRDRAPLHVRLVNPAGGRELATWTVGGRSESDEVAALPVPALGTGPRRLRLEFSSNADDAARAPRLGWAPQRLAGSARLGARAVEGEGPLVVPQYAWPSLALLWLWAAVPVAWLLAARRGTGLVLPVALGLAAFGTSLLLWQRDYTRSFAHWDADDFGACAGWLARWLTDVGGRAAAEGWLAHYIHAHNPLGPLLVAIGVVLGTPVHLSYVAVSALCSFVSLLIVWRMLGSILRLSPPAAAAGLVLYGTHLLFVRAFARPVTDALGNLLAVGTLALLLDRLRRPAAAQLGGLALLNVLHPLARPQGLAYIPFVTMTAIAIDARQARHLSLPAGLCRVALLALVPMAVLVGAYAAFGWWDNARALLAAAERYRRWFTAGSLGWALAVTLQTLPLLWIAVGRRAWSLPVGVLAAWLGYYVMMLVAVKAPFWARHFLPVVPAAIVLTAMSLDAAGGRVRKACFALVAVVCTANVAAVAHLVLDPTNLTLRLFRRVTLG